MGYEFLFMKGFDRYKIRLLIFRSLVLFMVGGTGLEPVTPCL
jgi:hypothetical protein